ncbi:uncharacterized protein METZ01_LOCUS501445, partial [marine metagenome]
MKPQISYKKYIMMFSKATLYLLASIIFSGTSLADESII